MNDIKITNLEYYFEQNDIWVELWQGKAHNAVLLDDFYSTEEGKKLIDADIKAYRLADRCHCEKYLVKDFTDALDWFKCVIRKNFAKQDHVADSSHRGSFVTHIPESSCKENK